MEFKFSVNDIFKDTIVELNPNLIPPGFKGDKRALWETINKISEVINTMGAASAQAQGIPKPITTADRLRNSDQQKLYLLIDKEANNGKGAVAGMLKTGVKGLYVFDRDGHPYQVTPPCVLDFYVHESRQRNGLGKILFEHMLQKENVQPVKLAVDRPSDKLLGFLNKYYRLNNPIKQMNNYVVFDGFFPEQEEKITPGMEATKSSLSPLPKKTSANGLQSAPFGRYGAPRPPCSMGQIIHNQSPTNQKGPEPAGDTQTTTTTAAAAAAVAEEVTTNNSPKLQRPHSLSIQQDEEQVEEKNDVEDNVTIVAVQEEIEQEIENINLNDDTGVIEAEKLPVPHNKSPTGKRTPGLTDQGFFDLKFYHNKLW